MTRGRSVAAGGVIDHVDAAVFPLYERGIPVVRKTIRHRRVAHQFQRAVDLVLIGVISGTSLPVPFEVRLGVVLGFVANVFEPDVARVLRHAPEPGIQNRLFRLDDPIELRFAIFFNDTLTTENLETDCMRARHVDLEEAIGPLFRRRISRVRCPAIHPYAIAADFDAQTVPADLEETGGSIRLAPHAQPYLEVDVAAEAFR